MINSICTSCYPLVGESVFARCLSSLKDERKMASEKFPAPTKKFEQDKKAFVEDIRQVGVAWWVWFN